MQKKIRLAALVALLTCIFAQVAFAAFPTVSNQEKSSNKPKYELYIPELSGAGGDAQSTINKVLAVMPEKALQEYRQATSYIDKEIRDNNRNVKLMDALVLLVNYDVKLLNEKTFSIVQQSYMYSGGAHGISATIAKTFNLRTGMQYQLADLFDSEEYVQDINNIIRREIVERGKQGVYHFTGLQNNQSFFITKEGLFIFFQQYEIAPYSEGIINFFIPYSQLKGFKSEIIYN